MARKIAVVFSLVLLLGCAEALPIIRTIVDVARILCEQTAAEQPPEQLSGQTAAAWCADPDNLRPFEEETLRAKRAASASAGLSAPEAE